VTILVEIDNADLAVAMAATATSALAGDQVTYNVAAFNRGPLDGTGAMLTTRIPANSALVSATGVYTVAGNVIIWNLGTLPISTEIDQYVTVQATSTGPMTGFSRITGTLPDLDLGNNTTRDVAPAGITDWWRAEGNTTNSVGSATAILENGATYVAHGYDDTGFSFDGVDDSVQVSSENLGSNYSVDFWVYPTRSSGLEHLISNDYRSTNLGHSISEATIWNTGRAAAAKSSRQPTASA